jgi:hypothetical protein
MVLYVNNIHTYNSEGQALDYLTFWSIFGPQGIVILIGFNSRIRIKQCHCFLYNFGYLILLGFIILFTSILIGS